MATRRYEASVFNQLVREAVEIGERHRHLPDFWADQQLIEVSADSAAQAFEMIADRFPTDKGYVISTLLEVKFDED
jgi:hypothetical protein